MSTTMTTQFLDPVKQKQKNPGEKRLKIANDLSSHTAGLLITILAPEDSNTSLQLYTPFINPGNKKKSG